MNVDFWKIIIWNWTRQERAELTAAAEAWMAARIR